MAFLRAWRPHVAEMVVAVDERAHPGTAAACAALADRVHVVPAAAYVERYLGWLHTQCSEDWVLRMDDDELPSDALLAALPAVIESREQTHFYLPCRWLYGGPDRYLVSEPWRSDVHARLVRNVGGLVRASGRVHSELEILGPHRIAEAPFLHVTALIDSVASRRDRASRYARMGAADRLDSGEPAGLFYLPEDVPDAITAPLGPGDTQRVRVFMAEAAATDPDDPAPSVHPAATVTVTEVEGHLHQIPSAVGPHDAGVRLVYPVLPLTVSTARRVQVEIENTGAGVWPAGSGGWPQVRVGSRWYAEDGTPLAACETRAFFTERVSPGMTTRLVVPIFAPAEPGAHVLHVDVVEELVRWFDRPATQTVTVLASRAMASPPVPSAPAGGRRVERSWRHPLRPRIRTRADVFAADLRRLHDALAPTAFAERYWVWGGMLLGWARDGALLGHDLHDADFGFLAGDAAFLEAVRALAAAGFVPHMRFRNNAGEPTEWCFVRGDAKFEFFAFQPAGDRLTYYVYADGGGDRGPPTQARGSIAAQPRSSFRFLDRTWGKHEDHERELTALYGDWHTPVEDWRYMADRAIVAREPWYPTARAWDGDLGELIGSRCMP